MVYQGSSDMTHKNMSISQITKMSESDAIMKEGSSHCNESRVEIMQPAIIKSSNGSKKQSDQAMADETSKETAVKPFTVDHTINLTVSEQIANEMDSRKKNWMKNYKTKLDLNDVLEIRNP
jgi:hypothetical protein